MKTDRRGFLGAAVAAIAGAATLAGGKTAEANSDIHAFQNPPTPFDVTPKTHDHQPGCLMCSSTNNHLHGRSLNDMLADARAEGYERAEFVKAKREESRAEAMNFESYQTAGSVSLRQYGQWVKMSDLLTANTIKLPIT